MFITRCCMIMQQCSSPSEEALICYRWFTCAIESNKSIKYFELYPFDVPNQLSLMISAAYNSR